MAVMLLHQPRLPEPGRASSLRSNTGVWEGRGGKKRDTSSAVWRPAALGCPTSYPRNASGGGNGILELHESMGDCTARKMHKQF